MKSVFYIAPHYMDREFDQKLKIVKEIARLFHLTILVGEKEGEEFNADQTAKRHDDADFFIADLSFERASCYYELGWAVGKNKPVFLIATSKTPIHQTHDKVLFYTDLKSFENTIRMIFKKIQDL